MDLLVRPIGLASIAVRSAAIAPIVAEIAPIAPVPTAKAHGAIGPLRVKAAQARVTIAKRDSSLGSIETVVQAMVPRTIAIVRRANPLATDRRATKAPVRGMEKFGGDPADRAIGNLGTGGVAALMIVRNGANEAIGAMEAIVAIGVTAVLTIAGTVAIGANEAIGVTGAIGSLVNEGAAVLTNGAIGAMAVSVVNAVNVVNAAIGSLAIGAVAALTAIGDAPRGDRQGDQVVTSGDRSLAQTPDRSSARTRDRAMERQRLPLRLKSAAI